MQPPSTDWLAVALIVIVSLAIVALIGEHTGATDAFINSFEK